MYVFNNKLFWMKDVVNCSRVVNDWIVNIAVCSLVHLLIASQHDVQSISQRNLNFTF